MPRATPSPVDKVKTAPPTGRPSRGVKAAKRDGTGRRTPQVAEVRARGFDTGTLAAIAEIDEEKPLTQLQKNFVKLWASGETILSAATRAGYSDGGTFAYRLVKYPNILKLYHEEKLAYEAAAGMSRKKVMDMLVKAYEHAELGGEPASMVSAAREIGRMCGYYEPVKHRIDVNVSGSIVMDRMNRLSDAELLKLITEGNGLALIEGASDEETQSAED